jgi:hypothetical protein
MTTSNLAKLNGLIQICNTNILFLPKLKAVISLINNIPNADYSKKHNRFTFPNNSHITVRHIYTYKDLFLLAGYEFDVIVVDTDIISIHKDIVPYLNATVRSVLREPEVIIL